jgi:hypothetical protein
MTDKTFRLLPELNISSLTRRVSYKKQKLLTHHDHIGLPKINFVLSIIVLVFCVVSLIDMKKSLQIPKR